jgi:hypothetical protein
LHEIASSGRASLTDIRNNLFGAESRLSVGGTVGPCASTGHRPLRRFRLNDRARTAMLLRLGPLRTGRFACAEEHGERDESCK